MTATLMQAIAALGLKQFKLLDSYVTVFKYCRRRHCYTKVSNDDFHFELKLEMMEAIRDS